MCKEAKQISLEQKNGKRKEIREGCGKSKWKFKMAFAMKGGGVSRGSRLPLSYFEK